MTLLHPDARVIDASTGTSLAGTALTARVQAASDEYAALAPGVVFLRMPTDLEAVVRYVAAWRARRPLALLDPALPPETLALFVDRFEPIAVVGLTVEQRPGAVPSGYRLTEQPTLGPLWVRETSPASHPHPDLAVLLATSGSTGNPRFVRLSHAAVSANTTAIVEALGITSADVAITTLPFYYSFGMSVLNTHLAVGATVVVESGGLVQRPFWDAVAGYGATSFSGVPYQFEILRRLNPDLTTFPSLRTFTQAGGALQPRRIREVHDWLAAVNGRLFIMYGQTEAGPRMTTLPAERVVEKVGSVGPAVSGGRLSIRAQDGTETIEPGVDGEVIYRGANVMMGYADCAEDLPLGDVQRGVLETGDQGHLDEDGYLYLTGRLKRIGKVFGVRVNLDDIEAMIDAGSPVAAVGVEDGIVVWIEGADPASLRGWAADLANRLSLHPSGITIRGIDALPLLANGKTDLRALETRNG